MSIIQILALIGAAFAVLNVAGVTAVSWWIVAALLIGPALFALMAGFALAGVALWASSK